MLFGSAPGNHFKTFLDSINEGKPLRLIETGCMRDWAVKSEWGDGWSTLYIARWVKAHPETWIKQNPALTFSSVDLNINSIELAHGALEAEGLAHCCTFHRQDSLKFLASVKWADFCFLDSCDGLQHGLDEFRLAVSTGAKLVIMDDLQTKAMWAIKEAKEAGWDVSFADRYAVMRRV